MPPNKSPIEQFDENRPYLIQAAIFKEINTLEEQFDEMIKLQRDMLKLTMDQIPIGHFEPVELAVDATDQTILEAPEYGMPWIAFTSPAPTGDNVYISVFNKEGKGILNRSAPFLTTDPPLTINFKTHEINKVAILAQTSNATVRIFPIA